MTFVRAQQALLPTGWATDVVVGFGADGRIASVEAATSKAGRAESPGVPGASAVAGGGATDVAILLPAPANVHSHAFQRAMAGLTEKRGPDPTDSFWTWRRLMYRFLDQLGPEHIEAITAFVQMEMLEAGYAANVEFHYLHHQPGGAPYANLAELSERIVAATDVTGIGLTLLPVHYQYGGCDQRALSHGQRRFGTDMDSYVRLWEAANRALQRLPDDACIGVAPHSLRAVSPHCLPALLELAPDAPFHMHLAEQLAEVTEVQQAWGARPVEWLLEHADVGTRWCLIHCTQMEAQETMRLAQSGAVVGLCPITESSLGDGIFDGVRFLDAGGRIAIGSDSNIRIALSEELRTLDYSQRLRDHSRAALATATCSTGRRLFDAMVQGGALASGRIRDQRPVPGSRNSADRNAGAGSSGTSGRCGAGIEVGQWADLLALDGEHPDLAGRRGDTLLDSFVFAGDRRMVRDVWSAGRHRVMNGHHVARERIVECYVHAMKRLGALI